MMFKNRTIKILIVAAASTVIGALLYAGGFYLIKEKVEEASLAVGELKQAEAVRGDIESVNQNIINTQKDRQRVEEFFVSSENVITFIERIEVLGSQVGVETTLSDLNEQNNSELMFSLRTKGSFQDTMLFAALLENLPFSLVLTKAYLSQVSGGEEDVANIWEGNFTATLRSFISDTR